jgi:glycosyltransferase XagB
MTPQDKRIGDLLFQNKLLSLPQLLEAQRLTKAWGMALGEITMARGWVKPLRYYQAVSRHFNLDFIDLLVTPPQEGLLESADIPFYQQMKILPWRREGSTLWVAVADPGPQTLLALRQRYGSDFKLVLTSKFDIIWLLQRYFETYFTRQALDALAEKDPEVSARTVFTMPQLLWGYGVFCLFGLWVFLDTIHALIILNALMAVYFLGNFALKALLVWVGGSLRATRPIEAADIAALHDEALPIYTILVPMFKEPEVLPILAKALREMDYPLGKLDIKLVLEASDHETIDAAKKLGLESVFEIIRVPPSQPQTKPKACNYALHFARGEYLVIFDAEDKPEPDQLKKTLIAFARAPANTVCIQARLNYYNSQENWLTRMFTLDYSLWFDLMLPGLEKLGIPIPLGGTSNHFKVDVLRQLQAWDPYNVTEDADLGVRITQRGYRVGTVDSTTYEEANCHGGNWIRQRSRWLKGYMQTWLVHMRHPIALYRSIGPIGFFGFQFFIGGTVMAALLNPIFWGMYLLWFFTRTNAFDPIFPDILLAISIFNLLIANASFIFLTMVAPLRRGLFGLIPYALTVFAYWVMLSIAGYKGLWQLIHKPFFWEKTQHGLSRVTAQEVAAALNNDDKPPASGPASPLAPAGPHAPSRTLAAV